jgi:hypothetical protein
MLLLAMALQHPYTNNNMLTMSRWELRKNDNTGVADEYLCHSCYVPRENWQNALPKGIRGREKHKGADCPQEET